MEWSEDVKVEKFIKKWEKTRKISQSAYALRSSLLIFISADMGNFIGRLLVKNWYSDTKEFLIDQTIGFLIVFPILIIISRSLYLKNENKYKRIINNKSTNTSI
jgi:hypothetical protein